MERGRPTPLRGELRPVRPVRRSAVEGAFPLHSTHEPPAPGFSVIRSESRGCTCRLLCHFQWHTRSVTDDDVDFLPGDGPTSGISVTLTAGTLQAIRERVGKRGVSAYLEKAAQRQIERDNLDELIADFDKVHGPADPEAVAAKRARLTGGGSHAGAAA